MTALRTVLKERKEYSEKDGSFEHATLSKDGIYGKTARYDRDFLVSTENKKYKVTHYGDLCYNPANLKFGVICLNKYGDAIFSPIYVTFEIQPSYDQDFIGTNLSRWDFINQALRYQEGTVYERMAVSPEDFVAIRCYLPSYAEQVRISVLTRLLDERIEKQRAYVECLKKYKRGLVSAILSQRICFSEHDDVQYPEWEHCTLQDAVDFLDGQRKPLESVERAKRHGSYPYYGASGIIDYIDDYLFDEPLLLLGEDGANIINRSTPLCFIATGKYWVNNHAHVMRPKEGHSIIFLCEYLESLDYTRYNTGTAQPKLNQEKCRGIELVLPCYEEQCRIAGLFSSMDQKLSYELHTLEQLCDFKRGLLQQMFI